MQIRPRKVFAGHLVRLRAAAPSLCAPVALALAAFAHAYADPPEPPAVVELYTSQGCPKCPPADRVIADLARRPNLVALSFAVATWDYIGWKDTLAEPAFSARQRAYAATRGDRLVFTPQAIIDGVDVVAGADRDEILKDVGTLPADGRVMNVPVKLSEANGRLHIDVGAGRPDRAPSEIYVLRVARAKTVSIDRGENSGRTQTYTNVVRAMNHLGTWNGAAQHFDVLELKAEDEGYVVLLQDGTSGHPGAIRGAAKTADL